MTAAGRHHRSEWLWGRCRRGLASAVVAITLAMPLTLAGCTAARNALGTPVSSCYRALPVAAGAVARRGHFAGVRLVALHDLAHHRRLAALAATIARQHRTVRSVCVVVFSGSFTSSEVAQPFGQPVTVARPYAVVVVSTPANRLDGTVLLNGPPWNLRDLV